MDGSVKFSIVIPVFQAGAYIAATVDRVVVVMETLAQPFEILLVDDHSTDNTWEVLKQIKALVPAVRILRLGHNVGQTPATMAGARHAKGELIVTLDDDLQHPAEEIPKLVIAFENNDVDIVFGDPDKRHHPNKQHPVLVAMGRFMFHQVYMRKYRKINFFTTFRLFRANLLSTNGGQWSHLFFIWQLNPARAMHISTQQVGRQQGQSNHTVLKLVRHFSPFLYYFSLRTVWVLQVLLLMGAVAYVASLYSAAGLDLSESRWVLVLALALIAINMFVAVSLRRIEQVDLTLTEG